MTCSESYRSLYGLEPTVPGSDLWAAWLSMVHPDDRQTALTARLAALQSGRLETEYRIVRPDGTLRWVVDRGTVVFDAGAQPRRIIGISADVTETKRNVERIRELQAELLHASRLSAMGHLAAGFAHEVSQPLGAAANFIGAAQITLPPANGTHPRKAA